MEAERGSLTLGLVTRNNNVLIKCRSILELAAREV